jgi:hypothetical protein
MQQRFYTTKPHKRHAVIRDHRVDLESAERAALILNASTATMVVA